LGVHWIEGIDAPGLAYPQRHDVIHTGYNSGYQAIGLAALFGATRILLLGFDFANLGAQVHWHGNHPTGLANGGQYPLWIAAMNRLAEDLQKSHIEVINCSRRSALKCFPRRAIEACV
jgi:hypothetical protein